VFGQKLDDYNQLIDDLLTVELNIIATDGLISDDQYSLPFSVEILMNEDLIAETVEQINLVRPSSDYPSLNEITTKHFDDNVPMVSNSILSFTMNISLDDSSTAECDILTIGIYYPKYIQFYNVSLPDYVALNSIVNTTLDSTIYIDVN
jgi:hypothetical protein